MKIKENVLYYLNCIWEFIKPWLVLLLMIAMIVVCAFLIRNTSVGAETIAFENARAGVIVDKEYIGPSSGLFRQKPAKYYITIQYDYKINTGLTIQTGSQRKTFSVDEKTYLNAELGMWFDSRGLQATERGAENSTSLDSTCTSCGIKLENDVNFCGDCGTKVKE